MLPFEAMRMRQATAAPAAGISFVGSKTANDLTGPATITVSLTDLKDASNNTAALQDGDLVLIAVTAHGSSGDVNFTPPAGWTEEADLFGDDTNDVNFYVVSKFMGAVPDASVALPGPGTAGLDASVTIHALRGVSQSNRLDVASVTVTGFNTGRPNPGAITPVTPGAWIYVAGGGYGTTVGGELASSDLSVATNHFRSIGFNTNAQVGAGIKTDWTTGAFDPAQFTGGSTASASSWAALTMALRPA